MSARRVLVAWAIGLLVLFAAWPAGADSGYSAKGTRLREKERIRIDGTMNESAWQRAPVLKGWHQTRVTVSAKATEDTEVRIMYDRDNLYFGFHCLDSQPDKVTAYTVQNEGFLHQEDNVTVIIDTYLDHRNAYYFWTNALGVRTDGRIVDDGEAFSTDWQGEWESKGSIVKDGWIVEIRIPFSNFQYDDAPEHTFGILLDREEARLEEWSNWTPDGVNSAKVSRYPHLTGLEGIASRSLVGVTGYVGGQVSIPEGRKATFQPGGGFDVRFSPTPWATMKLTVNPDFSQVEVDQDVLWLNPEERQLPERRPFFLEGGDLFISPIQLFYSRRIAPRADDRVYAGLQAVGKRDGFGFSVLDVQTQEHHPGAPVENVNSAVARVQKDIGKRSTVNVLGTSRIGDTKNGLVSADANIHVAEEVFVTGQASKSFGTLPDKDAEAYQAGIHRFDTNSEVWLQYEDIGKSFRSPLGYVPYVDKQSVYAHGFYSLFTKHEALPRIDMTYDDAWRMSKGGQEQRHLRDAKVLAFLNHDFAISVDAKFDKVGAYDNNIGTVGFVVQPNDWQSLTLSALGGSFMGGNFMGMNGQANWKLGNHLAVKLSGFYTVSWELPGGSPLLGRSSMGYQWAFYGQLRYQFSPDLFARVTFQQGDVFGLADLNGITGRVFDAVLAWHYHLASDAFLVYTQQPLDGTQEHRILTKVSLTY